MSDPYDLNQLLTKTDFSVPGKRAKCTVITEDNKLKHIYEAIWHGHEYGGAGIGIFESQDKQYEILFRMFHVDNRRDAYHTLLSYGYKNPMIAEMIRKDIKEFGRPGYMPDDLAGDAI